MPNHSTPPRVARNGEVMRVLDRHSAATTIQGFDTGAHVATIVADEVLHLVAAEGLARHEREALALASYVSDRHPIIASIVADDSQPTVARERAFSRIARVIGAQTPVSVLV